MNIQAAYNDWSATYDTDENLTRDLDQRVTRNTLKNLHFNSILEIGCGTGKNTELLSQIGENVHAVDFSQGMIDKAKEKIRASNVRFSIANIKEKWPYEDQSYDLIVCNLVLEHIEDLTWVFSESSRSLGGKGRFFVCELHPFKQYQGKKAIFNSGKSMTEIPAFVHHITDYIGAARNNRLALLDLQEWWHEEDQGGPPRLVSFMFEK
jgi:malonyl-CoA O-methyltransferase